METLNQADKQQIVLEHQKIVASLCRRVLGPGQESEDAAQEIWLKVFESLSQFRGESKVSTWIYQIAYRTLLHYRSKQQGLKMRELNVAYHIDAIVAPSDEPDLKAWAKSMCERCQQGVLFCLDPQSRLVFLFRFVAGLDYAVIASIIDKSETNTRQIASRARRLVGRFLFNDCAYHPKTDAQCKCGMDQIIQSLNLRSEFKRMRQLLGHVHTYKIADAVLPPLDYWRNYLPNFVTNQ